MKNMNKKRRNNDLKKTKMDTEEGCQRKEAE